MLNITALYIEFSSELGHSMIMKDTTLQTGTYRHYKGKDYLVQGIAKHSETLEDLVVYSCLHENNLSPLWVRPLEMFIGEVEVDGEKKPRFEYIG
jgi:hypothetical protein